MKKNIIFTLAFAVISCYSFGQLAVTSGTLTPQQYVENVLIGPGVTVSNVQFNNNLSYSGNQIGQFNYVGNQIPFAYGLILASGGVAGAIGPNNSGSSTVPVTIPTLSNDAQLNSIAGFATNDVGKLEFNFVPAGNTVSFNFLFGSEEYNEYVCGTVNDVFGFFVSGPNPLGGNYINTNLALVPSTIGTTNIPISINTVNNGSVGSSGSATNCSMLDPNWTANNVYFSGAPGTNFQADGMTELINIQFNVVCGEVYQFKFAVADGGDAAFDSWVFLQSGSFSSDVVDVAVATVSGDTTIVEGCNFADIVFTRPEGNMLDTLSIIYTIGGTATEGVDYANLMDTIIFLPGVDTVIVNLTPIQDNIIEGYESVIISVNIINPCGDTIVSSGTIYVWDGPIIDSLWSTNANCLPTGSVHVDIVAPSVPATYLWTSPNALTFSGPDWQNINPGWYYITVTQAQCSVSDSIQVEISDTLTISSLSSSDANCFPTGSVNLEISPDIGQTIYLWTNSNSSSTWNEQDLQNIYSGWYYITVTQGQCSVSVSIQVEISDTLTISSLSSSDANCLPTGSVNLEISPDVAQTTYLWTNSNSSSTWNEQDLQNIYSGWYYITVTQGQCSVSDSIQVEISDTLTISSLSSSDANCLPTGSVNLEISPDVAQTTYLWTNSNSSSTWNEQDLQNIYSGWYYITVTQGQCSVSDSVEVLLTAPPVANFSVVAPLSNCQPALFSFVNNSTNATSYNWTFGDGSISSENNPSNSYSNQTFGTYIVQLIAFVDPLCTSDTTLTINLDVCDCTNPSALNFNPLANIDDGSCTPEVYAPNVFTPNSDAQNPTFFLSGKNIVSLELNILNRWGSVVFSQSSSDLVNNNPSWDGKIDGDLAKEGIYFYIYKATSISNQIVEGHGFLHLILDK